MINLSHNQLIQVGHVIFGSCMYEADSRKSPNLSHWPKISTEITSYWYNWE
jgi:predicted nucleic acid-binding Zn ribbon protein